MRVRLHRRAPTATTGTPARSTTPAPRARARGRRWSARRHALRPASTPPGFRPTTIPASATEGAASTHNRRSRAERAVAPTTPARPIPAPASRATRRPPSVTTPAARAARGAAATHRTPPRATTATPAPTETSAAAACAAASPSCATRPIADTCRDASTAVVHDRLGRCAAGACSLRDPLRQLSRRLRRRRLQPVRLDRDDE